MIEYYLIKYYKTKEHKESDAYSILEDKFYSEKAYTEKAYDLMYRFFYYSIEVFRYDDLINPIRRFKLNNFNRKRYRKTNFKF